MNQSELRDTFRIEASERLARIVAAFSDLDGAHTVRAEAHALRGAAAMLGLSRIADLAELIENHADAPTAVLAEACEALRVGIDAATSDEPEPFSIEVAIQNLESATLGPGR